MMMLTPQQEAAQMFVTEQAAEVRTLDNLTTHNVPAGLAFQDSKLDSLLDAAQRQQSKGDYQTSVETLKKFEAVPGSADDAELVRYEYLTLRASDVLKTFTVAQVDRIVEHKQVLDDQTNLAEIYFRAARFKYHADELKSARKYLKKAKKFVENEPEWADDIARLDALLNPRVSVGDKRYDIYNINVPGNSLDCINGEYALGIMVIPGRFGKNSAIAQLGGRSVGGWSTGVAKAAVFNFIGHHFLRDVPLEFDAKFVEMNPAKTLKGYGRLPESEMFTLGIRKKFPLWYVEGKVGGKGIEYSKNASFTQKEDGSHTMNGGDELSKIFANQFKEKYGHEIPAGSKVDLTISDNDASGGPFYFNVGAGVHGIMLDKRYGTMLDWAGLSFERFVRETSGIVMDLSTPDNSWAGYSTEEQDIGHMKDRKSRFESYDLMLRAEASLIQNKRFDLAVQYNRMLADFVQDDKGLPFIQDLLQAQRTKQSFGVNVMYMPPLSKRLLIQGYYIHDTDPNDNGHHRFSIGLNYLFSLNESCRDGGIEKW